MKTEKREKPELVLGGNYYVYFGTNEATSCVLREVIENGGNMPTQVRIELRGKSLLGYESTHIVYSDEISSNKKGAIANPVTF